MTTTLFETIADQLRRAITSGEYEPGAKLPTEDQLVRDHRVSRGTVRNAYSQLVAEGLVVAQGTRGHRVLQVWNPLIWKASAPENNESTDDGPQDTWAHGVREHGHTPSEEIRTEIVMADDKARRYLQLPGAVPLLARHRFRYVDRKPSCTAHSFYLREHVTGTPVEIPEQVYPGVYAVFAARGLQWVRTVDEVGSRTPTRDEARELRIGGGTHVIEIIRVSYTAHELPVRMTVFVLPGDRYKVSYEHGGESR